MELFVAGLALAGKELEKKGAGFRLLLFFREHEQTRHRLKRFAPKVLRFEALRTAWAGT